MSVIKYDYLAFPFIKNGKLDVVYKPIVFIKLSANHKLFPWPIKCIIDSGSDFNLLPAKIGEDLGLKIKSGEKILHIGIANVGITAYKHPVKLYLDGYSFNTDIHFSYDHRIPLLGRHGFFNYFKKITFNENALQLELTY